ncbi:MAG: hydroxyacid dehydrogenase [Pseudomonadota bacterium]|jgi:uncharacterized oxidoreductase
MDAQIPTTGLRGWVFELFRSAGASAHEAELGAHHLVEANLAGHDSHGIGMAPRYIASLLAGELQWGRTIKVITDAGSLLVVDGQGGLGQSVGLQAMALAIERAQQLGCAVLALRHAHHLGRIGHWAEQAIAAGLASVHFTNVVAPKPAVAPHGGAEARFVTNPFTVGLPVPGHAPIVLDFATSAIAQGKVRVAYNRGESTPPGSLIDAQGLPTDNPAVLFEPQDGPFGALRTMGAHKGSALAITCELLAGALSGGLTMHPGCPLPKVGVWNNMLAIVFDPTRMGTGEAFEQQAREFMAWVRSARLAPDNTDGAILMPGDAERQSRTDRARSIAIDATTLQQLDAAAAAVAGRFGLSPGPLSALDRGCA